jgi:hypothetical protein
VPHAGNRPWAGWATFLIAAEPSPRLLIDWEEDRTLRAVHADGEDVLVASDLVR